MARPVYNPEEESRDLGFGSALAETRGLRLLNRDGSFNVERREPRWWSRLFRFHYLVTMRWPPFLFIIIAAYLLLNAVFATLYIACGPEALKGEVYTSPWLRAYFFSVHTFATIGYGNVAPVTTAANMLVTLESLIGLLSFALATGVLFARFSRPLMDVEFSKYSVMAPYRGISAWMFRTVNKRDFQLIDVSARVVLSRFQSVEGVRKRVFHPLALEREKVAFFPLAWAVVHPIDEASPLWGWSDEQLQESQAEFLVLMTGTEETFSQTVHTRTSYAAHEVVWNARLAPVFQADIHHPTINWERFHAVEPLAAPASDVVALT
jgi:inward rectifier potassium channel